MCFRWHNGIFCFRFQLTLNGINSRQTSLSIASFYQTPKGAKQGLPSLACQHTEVLSGERRGKAEKRKIYESTGRLFLAAQKKSLAQERQV